ncbi:MAG: hypothetical protein UHN47_05650 [Lachnospiraceae bacterium]|nr:hypothetical protein [Lachnospiraceae bacterium]
MRAYLLDEGVLLTKEDAEYEAYATVYDKKYGYYDEGQCYKADKTTATINAKRYVEDGVENTYAIVSNTWLPNDFDFEEGYVEDEKYKLEDVIYSVAKINGEIVENFLGLQN